MKKQDFISQKKKKIKIQDFKDLIEPYFRKDKCKDLIACFACGIRLWYTVDDDDDNADEIMKPHKKYSRLLFC